MIYPGWSISSFVILMQGGRVGSSYLTTALDSHPQVRAHGEILVGLGREEQEAVYRGIFRRRIASRKKSVGFKTKLTDLADSYAFGEDLRRYRVKTIILTRENLIKLVVSWINSERLHDLTGRYQLPAKAPVNPLPPLVIDLDDFEQRLHQVEVQKRYFGHYVDSLAVPTLEISYEQMFSHDRGWLAEVLDFLHLRPQPLRGTTRKVTSDDLRDAVANFEVLQQRYAGTRYAWMVEERDTVHEAPVRSDIAGV